MRERLEITWLDAHVSHGWQDPGDEDKFALVCHSIGYLWHEDDQVISLVESLDTGETHIGCVNVIPKSCVIGRVAVVPLDETVVAAAPSQQTDAATASASLARRSD